MIKSPISSRRSQRGTLIASVLIMMFVLLIVGISLMSYSVGQFIRVSDSVFEANAMQVAEAGIEQSLYELNLDDDFAGYPVEQVFFDNDSQGRGVFTVTVSDIPDSEAKEIVSTGKVYRRSGDSEPLSTRAIKVTVVGTESSGYSVHTGVGGLILGGSANITNTEVYVNGTITMTGSAKIGTHNQPAHVEVAHMSCPPGNNPGASYPKVCSQNESGQPISMAHSTNIFGTVCATNQTSVGPNNNIQPGNGGEGLKLGCVANPVSTPTYDRAGHLARVATSAPGNSGAYVCGPWPFDREWPANLQLTGNVTVNGSCDIVLKGDVHITGNLTLGGASRIRVDDSLGDVRPVIMVDGTINVGGSAALITNSSGTGIHFVSFKSSASCSPNCTSLTGNDLKASQNTETVFIGGGVNVPGMVFGAYWGKLRLGGSGTIGAAYGQTVDMSGAGTVVFGTTIASGSKTWAITSYQQIFPD